MVRAKPTHYRLTPAAEADLTEIWLYTAENWTVAQADRYMDSLERTFDTLLSMPEIARERMEFEPPVRIHPSAQHIVIYRILEDHLAILRVLGGRQNWQAHLEIGE